MVLHKTWWVFYLLAGGQVCCGEGSLLATLDLSAAGENFPCTGMRRLRATVFYDEQNGRGRDSFGKFYDDSGACNLPAGLPLEIDRLPFSQSMWVMVEGFDSSSRRRLCLAQSGTFSRREIEAGALSGLTLQRESVGGNFLTASLVIESLPGSSSLEPIDSLDFSIDYGTPNSIGGSFYREGEKPFSQMTLVISNLGAGSGKKILITARRGAQQLANWRQENFDIPQGALFVQLQPEKI